MDALFEATATRLLPWMPTATAEHVALLGMWCRTVLLALFLVVCRRRLILLVMISCVRPRLFIGQMIIISIANNILRTTAFSFTCCVSDFVLYLPREVRLRNTVYQLVWPLLIAATRLLIGELLTLRGLPS